MLLGLKCCGTYPALCIKSVSYIDLFFEDFVSNGKSNSTKDWEWRRSCANGCGKCVDRIDVLLYEHDSTALLFARGAREISKVLFGIPCAFFVCVANLQSSRLHTVFFLLPLVRMVGSCGRRYHSHLSMLRARPGDGFRMSLGFSMQVDRNRVLFGSRCLQ